jgi:hypothetical protein
MPLVLDLLYQKGDITLSFLLDFFLSCYTIFSVVCVTFVSIYYSIFLILFYFISILEILTLFVFSDFVSVMRCQFERIVAHTAIFFLDRNFSTTLFFISDDSDY